MGKNISLINGLENTISQLYLELIRTKTTHICSCILKPIQIGCMDLEKFAGKILGRATLQVLHPLFQLFVLLCVKNLNIWSLELENFQKASISIISIKFSFSILFINNEKNPHCCLNTLHFGPNQQVVGRIYLFLLVFASNLMSI